MAGPAISVIIRVRDERANLARCLDILELQRGVGEVEVIVVDGGSADGTAQLAARRGATVLGPDPAGPFSFGAALNRGAGRACHDVLVALSAHAFPPTLDWLATAAEWLSDPGVACTTGDRHGPDGEPLLAAVRQDAALARRRPDWGYGNAAGAFRAQLWRERPFRADLAGCEDKEWAWHWLQRDRACVVDPALVVQHDHTHDGIGAIYRRARREAAGYAAFLDAPPGPASPGQLVAQWWSDTRWYASPLRARLSHRRAARLLGAYAGYR
jgi:glycosyltransferase involved in cell wall biosynthesis